MTTQKNTKAIITGETILPNNNPNLNQIKFRGVKIDELTIPKIKNINDNITDQVLNSSPFIIGYNATAKKNIKNTIPKLLFEEIFIFLSIIKFYIIVIFFKSMSKFQI